MARDKKILALVDTINDTLRLISQGQNGEQLREIELYKDYFKSMALQIQECGYFIHDYVQHDFGELSTHLAST